MRSTKIKQKTSAQMDPAMVVEQYYNTFNKTLLEFIDKLTMVFPDDMNVKAARLTVHLTIKTDRHLPCTNFVEQLSPHMDKLMNREENLLYELCDEIYLLKQMKAKELFQKTNLPQQTKKSIWDYLCTLAMISNTITIMKSGLMQIMSKVIHSFIKNIKAGKINFNNIKPQDIIKEIIVLIEKDDTIDTSTKEEFKKVEMYLNDPNSSFAKMAEKMQSNVVPTMIQNIIGQLKNMKK